ncbi:MAG: hypothetical protein IJA34_16310 [Lachnospiraceae bacterium]|nr:hypothetical protein [Lachnospiraceae bacterium]
MKKSLVILGLVSLIALVSCGNKTGSEENVTNKVDSGKDNFSIDISEIDEDKIQFSSGNMDMNVYNPSIEELSEHSDVIFKGKLTDIDSYLDDWEMKSNYTFEIDEYYKGDVEGAEFTINTLGGIMKEKDYKELISKVMDIDEEEWEPGEDMYVACGYQGFPPLDLNSEYVIYAAYNKDKDNYYPTYYFYGIYKNIGNNEFERFGLDETDTHIKKLEELKESIK